MKRTCFTCITANQSYGPAQVGVLEPEEINVKLEELRSTIQIGTRHVAETAKTAALRFGVRDSSASAAEGLRLLEAQGAFAHRVIEKEMSHKSANEIDMLYIIIYPFMLDTRFNLSRESI